MITSDLRLGRRHSSVDTVALQIHMSESVPYTFDFFHFQQDNFIVRQPVFTIDDLAEAGLPDGARRDLEESGARLRAVVTGADGACGMHAAFGHPFHIARSREAKRQVSGIRIVRRRS